MQECVAAAAEQPVHIPADRLRLSSQHSNFPAAPTGRPCPSPIKHHHASVACLPQQLLWVGKQGKSGLATTAAGRKEQQEKVEIRLLEPPTFSTMASPRQTAHVQRSMHRHNTHRCMEDQGRSI